MIIIVDIDNTLALNHYRYNLATKEDGIINWDILYAYEHMINDIPNYPMIELVKFYKKEGFKIVIFTSRPESTKKVTDDWLVYNNIPYDKLYMRTKKDHKIKDDILKKQMYDSFITDSVYCAFDDSDTIINLWSSLEIPTFKVRGIV
jgi:hypothetical protein